MTSNDALLSKSNYEMFKCVICQKSFDDGGIYENHLKVHKKSHENSYHCDICNKSFAVPARLIRHYRTHTGEKPFKCEYCSKTFSVKENLNVHRRIHTKERPYKCNICKSAFEHSGKLHRHMRIHTGERPHKCSFCLKTFIQSGQLIIHMRTHTGEKPYICKSCKKGFTCSKQLKVHMRTHTGEKPYVCDICGKSFGYNHVLKLHQVAHYGEKFYKCSLCQETFNTKKSMELHIKTHSNFNALNDNENADNDCPNSHEKTDFISNTNSESVESHERFSSHDDDDDDDEALTISNDESKLVANEKANSINNTIKPDTLELSFCGNADQQLDKQTLSKILKSQSHLIMNANLFITNHSNFMFTEMKGSSSITLKKEISNHYCIYNDFKLSPSCVCKVQNNDIFPNEYLSKFTLSANNFKQCIEIDYKIIEPQQQVNKKKLENTEIFNELYKNKIASPINTSPLNLAGSANVKNFSLPPRKRCKMILESMEIDKSALIPTKSFKSVIRFAKAENLNSPLK